MYKTYSLGLRACYAQITDARRILITPVDADVVLALDLAAPPPIVWEWLNDPQKRGVWQARSSTGRSQGAAGRRRAIIACTGLAGRGRGRGEDSPAAS